MSRLPIDPFLLRHWRHIDILATLQLRKHNSNRQGCRVIAWKGTHTELSRTAQIATGPGRFSLNRKWASHDPAATLFVMREEAKLTVDGPFDCYSGAQIYINKGAHLELGSGYINHRLNLSCFEHITIGNNVVISENVTLRDSDDHAIEGALRPMTQPIVIGDHVWIGMNATILKGVTVGDGAVIAAGAVVTRDVPARCLAAGVPARVIKENVSWQ